jgi:hypothetical protein
MKKTLIAFRNQDELEEYTKFKRSTHYKMKHTKRHPEVYTKISGSVFLVCEAWDRLVEQGQGAS